MIGFKSYSQSELPEWVDVGNFSAIDKHVTFRDTGSGRTLIEHDVWIDEGAVISRGIKIGTGCHIEWGAVVGQDVPPYSVVISNPTRGKSAIITKRRFSDFHIAALLRLKWWEVDYTTFRTDFRDSPMTDAGAFYNLFMANAKDAPRLFTTSTVPPSK